MQTCAGDAHAAAGSGGLRDAMGRFLAASAELGYWRREPCAREEGPREAGSRRQAAGGGAAVARACCALGAWGERGPDQPHADVLPAGEGRCSRARAPRPGDGGGVAHSGNRGAQAGRRVARQRGSAALLQAAAVMAVLSALAAPAAANSVAVPELRFGTVSWTQIGPKTIRFTVDSAWTPLSSPALASDTLECEPRFVEPYSCRNPNEKPKVGAILHMRTPTDQPTSNRWVFGDEHLTGRTNGTALRNMKVVEDKSTLLPTDRGYLRTLTTLDYHYPHHGVFHAALTGCCRSWDKLLNHRGYGWNMSATVVVDSLWEPISGLPPSKGGPYSPAVPFVPEILVTKGVTSQFYVKGIDHVRAAAPGLCAAGAGGVTTGCRLSYALANHAEAGFNVSIHSFRQRLAAVANPVVGTTDLGFPHGVYRSGMFPGSSTDELDARIELDPVTGRLTVPAEISDQIGVLTSDTDLYAMSVVVRVTAHAVARPDGRAARDRRGGELTPAITVSLDFPIIFQRKFVPRVALPQLVSVPAFTPGPADVSTAPYVDFICEYRTDYQLNATGRVHLLTPPNGLNYTALGQHGRFLRLDHVEDARFGSNYLVNLSWSAPCSATGLYPACVVSCTDAVQPICSPPACFRMEVRGDCIQGDATWLAPTPPEYLGHPDLEPLSVLMGHTLQFRVRAGGVPIGERDGITVSSLVGHANAAVVPLLGVDRFIAVLANPGLPNGATSTLNVHEGQHNVTRLFQWTPQPGQEGITYMVCFQAQSERKPNYCMPAKRCVRVKAVVPSQEIKAEIVNVLPLDPPKEEPAGRPPPPPPPAPRFIDAEDALAENTRIQIAPGCLVKVRVSVERSIQGATLVPEPTVGLPPGARLAEVPELMGKDLGGGVFRDT
eukprot:Tamp_02404.p1 GENE.Tamp_02404~~Tamp_02404.p1  ORF type:complete len:889 (-),score=154.40 Tamp_02404:1609-4275(-)